VYHAKKIPHLSRQITHQAIFGRLRKNRSAAQRARGLSTKTGDSQKVPGLVSKWDGVALPRVSPSSFDHCCAMVRCHGGKSACHVFSDNTAFFHAEHGAIWSVVDGSGEH